METDVSTARVTRAQGLLFPPAPREVCNRIGLNWLAALKLHEAGWLSFDPQRFDQLEENQESELVFVGSLVAGGCDESMLKQMLAGLEKPYQYRLHRIYFDWQGGQWRLLPVVKDSDPDEIFTNWIEELMESGDIDKILELKDSIAEAEAKCRQ